MRGKTKLVSFVLCAVFLLGFALTANAQTNWAVSSNPEEVTQWGVTELMGRVRLATAAASTTVASTITVTYQGAAIKNAAGATNIPNGLPSPGGIVVQGPANCTSLTFSAIANTGGTGGQVIISLPNGCPVSIAAGIINIDGVRVDVSTKAIGTDVQASLSSSPSTANTFINVSVVRVATVNKALALTTAAGSAALCHAGTNPSITVTEGFAGAFVQYVTSTAGTIPSNANPAAARVKYGANKNVHIHVVVSTLPTDVTLDWSNSGTPWPEMNGLPSNLELISQSATGDDALFEFTTNDEGLSDAALESFKITPVLTANPDTSEPGSATVQAKLEPQDTPTSTDIPRFNHPYINSPADNFVSVNKCTTNLLFTFLTNATGVGFDSGVAIANTSKDPYGTAAQHGTITLYFYGTNAPAPLTTPDVPAGTEWSASLSTIAPGFQGYIIAIAQFQFGHGYCFITGKYNAGSVFDVAEGYVAIVIPDPTFTPNSDGVATRYAGPPPQNNIILPPSSGEQLGQ